MWSIFDKLLAENEENSEGHGYKNSAEIMVEMYLKEPVLSHIEHNHLILMYWEEKKSLWPCLADLACKYLSIPPSSATSKRLFSSAADVIYQE